MVGGTEYQKMNLLAIL